MKKLLLISAGLAALIGPATAADLARPVYRRPVVAAPVYTWTGFYVGGNVGGSWGNARTDIAGSATTVAFPNLPVPPGPPGFPSTIAFTDSNTARLNGIVGGGQIGYKFQFSPRWVLGLESDIQGSGERGSGTFVDPFSTGICTGLVAVEPGQPVFCGTRSPANGAAVTAYDAKVAWFGTVRGVLGVLITNDVLLYGTGGLAYGRVELSGNTGVTGSVTFPPTVAFTTPGASVFSESKTNVGIAVGGGIEGKCAYLLPAGWTWKVEYLYVDLGSLDIVSPFPAAQPTTFATPFAGALTTHTRFTDNIVRVGLNYKFGYAAAPAVYK
jgi:outer membrane immunogenic protein